MVARNITPPFRFVCFTDSVLGIAKDVECHPLPEIPIEIPKTRLGIWEKARLWGPELADLQGSVLFLDLDLVITDSLDNLFDFGEQGDVILARNPVRPLERLGQTSVFRFPVGKLTDLFIAFCNDPVNIANKFVFEQRFVTRQCPGGVKFFPTSWIRHFRTQNMRTLPLNYFLQPKLSSRTKIVIFPGGLLPEHAIQGGWKGRLGLGSMEHFRGYRKYHAQNESRLSYLQHFTLPTQWVKDSWHE